uniref:ATP-dependent RNA helicase n=1 Tax=Trypanosoma congolense (strain IL3000) TaxID=1068625 RepID=G0UUI2_TRYCI|nr:unnamed protein product [Trypanosoma congolense IL3000]
MTCASVDWLYASLVGVLLKEDADNIFALHGQMKLEKRQRVHRAVTKRRRCVLVCTDVAARGLDIPEVGVVVQYDPPVDPATFIHRIGRTARMGRQGESLVFLMPQELEYVAFMKLQNVMLLPYNEARDDIDAAHKVVKETNVKRTLTSSLQEKRKSLQRAQKEQRMSRKERRALLQEEKNGLCQPLKHSRKEIYGDLCESPAILQLRNAARHEEGRKILELATRAFVSFIRAYKEHECRYIFQLQLIDLTDLTHSFALFKIPSCGEIKHMRILKVPLQDELSDIVESIMKQTREKREREAQEREVQKRHEEREESIEDGLLAKRHRTERNEKLEALKLTRMSRGERSPRDEAGGD